MISEKEVRVGNWVLLDGNFTMITGIFSELSISNPRGFKYYIQNANNLDYDIKRITGISITPEILRILGFNQAENYQKGVLSKNGIRVMKHNGDWQFNDLTRNKVLTSVHQLQNLFFSLTGEELTWDNQ